MVDGEPFHGRTFLEEGKFNDSLDGGCLIAQCGGIVVDGYGWIGIGCDATEHAVRCLTCAFEGRMRHELYSHLGEKVIVLNAVAELGDLCFSNVGYVGINLFLDVHEFERCDEVGFGGKTKFGDSTETGCERCQTTIFFGFGVTDEVDRFGDGNHAFGDGEVGCEGHGLNGWTGTGVVVAIFIVLGMIKGVTVTTSSLENAKKLLKGADEG